MADISIGGLLSWIDGRKRIAADAARGLLSDPVGEAGIWGSAAVESLKDINTNMLTGLSRSRSAIPELKQEGTNQVLGSLLNMPGMAGVMTYHGTPHTVPKYDLSKIGTGEGAQAYGHGMYFAENPAVAKEYAGMSKPNPKDVDVSLVAAAKDFIANGMNPHAGLKTAYKSATTKEIEDAVLMARGGYKPNLYKQDLPDEMLPRMLQWDKPLSEQPKKVRELVEKVQAERVAKDSAKGYTPLKLGDIKRDAQQGQPIEPMTGGQIWNYLAATRYSSPEEATDLLRSLGVPGLSYLDQGSRATGKGSRNHVIWDQSLLDRMLPQRVE